MDKTSFQGLVHARKTIFSFSLFVFCTLGLKYLTNFYILKTAVLSMFYITLNLFSVTNTYIIYLMSFFTVDISYLQVFEIFSS